MQAPDTHEALALQGFEILNLPWTVCAVSILLLMLLMFLISRPPVLWRPCRCVVTSQWTHNLTDRRRYLWLLASRSSNVVASPATVAFLGQGFARAPHCRSVVVVFHSSLAYNPFFQAPGGERGLVDGLLARRGRSCLKWRDILRVLEELICILESLSNSVCLFARGQSCFGREVARSCNEAFL